MQQQYNPFRISNGNSALPAPLRWIWGGLCLSIEKLLGLDDLARVYDALPRNADRSVFLQATLDMFGINHVITTGSLASIPKTGPAIVVANHPFGGIEGMIMASVLERVRPDFKIMANGVLGRIPELRDYFLFVDPFGTDQALKANIGPLRESISWLRKGGLLAIFPSGTVSHLHMNRREVSDPDWSPTIARIISRTGAPAVPVFFCGSNGPLFQAIGVLHPLFRTMMLPRELVNKRGQSIELRIGKTVPYEKLASLKSDERILAYLRLRTYILGDQPEGSVSGLLSRWFSKGSPKKSLEPIVSPESAHVLATEVESLPKHQTLVEDDSYSVHYCRAQQIPHLLREIGRLRELTFREAKEGTGRSIDLDRFDNYYLHLFVWNKRKREIVGAYRMGKTDWILRRFGKKGLYTNTLFTIKGSLLRQIHPALEMGRSFIRSSYQRNYGALLMLWRGIGSFVARNPRYKVLFGPVSINREYETVSRQLIVSFLENNNYYPELAKLIKARNPLKNSRIRGVDQKTTSIIVRDVHEITDLLGDIEKTQKSIPVLLRQYLRLGGKILGFNVDPDFGDVLDGLLVVDMSQTEPKLLERYLGREGAQDFLEYHRKRRAQRTDPPKTLWGPHQ